MATMRDLSEEDIANIKCRINRGDKYADIASDYRLNQGRIADLKFGRIRPDIRAAEIPPGVSPPPNNKKSDQPSLF
jgi:hypothetical protein